MPDSPSPVVARSAQTLSNGERRGKKPPSTRPMFASWPVNRQPLVGATATLRKAQIATSVMRGLANTQATN